LKKELKVVSKRDRKNPKGERRGVGGRKAMKYTREGEGEVGARIGR